MYTSHTGALKHRTFRGQASWILDKHPRASLQALQTDLDAAVEPQIDRVGADIWHPTSDRHPQRVSHGRVQVDLDPRPGAVLSICKQSTQYYLTT